MQSRINSRNVLQLRLGRLPRDATRSPNIRERGRQQHKHNLHSSPSTSSTTTSSSHCITRCCVRRVFDRSSWTLRSRRRDGETPERSAPQLHSHSSSTQQRADATLPISMPQPRRCSSPSFGRTLLLSFPSSLASPSPPTPPRLSAPASALDYLRPCPLRLPLTISPWSSLLPCTSLPRATFERVNLRVLLSPSFLLLSS